MSSTRRLLFLMAVLLQSAAAQNPPTTGTPPLGSFVGGPDTINLANLNSHLDIPVVHKPGRGTDFTYDLSYDSSVWGSVTSGSATTWQPVGNSGWRGQTEAATGYVSYYAVVFPCAGNQHYTVYTFWTYHDPFGAAHSINGVTETSGGTGCGIASFNLSGTATDDSGYVIKYNESNIGHLHSQSGQKSLRPFYPLQAAQASPIATVISSPSIPAAISMTR